MTHPIFNRPRPVIIGHRGAAGSAPENSLASFQQALEEGAQILESDIHVTSDGFPILLHDSTVDRTTNGTGEAHQLSLSEIQALDASANFSAASGVQAQTSFESPVRIPTLREAFEAFPNAAFNLEIKGNSEALVKSVVSLAQEMKREDQTLLTAGEDKIQALLREERARTGAESALGASLADILEVIRSAQEHRPPETDSMAIQVPSEFGGRPLITQELVDHCHQHQIEVHVWTINDAQEMRDLLDLGVDGLVTDVPARMAHLLAQRR